MLEGSKASLSVDWTEMCGKVRRERQYMNKWYKVLEGKRGRPGKYEYVSKAGRLR